MGVKGRLSRTDDVEEIKLVSYDSCVFLLPNLQVSSAVLLILSQLLRLFSLTMHDCPSLLVFCFGHVLRFSKKKYTH